MAIMSSWSLRLRTLLVALVPAFLMFAIMLAYHVSVRLQDAGLEQARSGTMMATQLAASADFAIISGNIDTLTPQIDTILAQPGVASVRILDIDQRVLFTKQNPKWAKNTDWHRYMAVIRQQTINLDDGDG